MTEDILISIDQKEKLDEGRVLDLFQRWGNSASLALLDNPACMVFSVSGIEGIIGFRVESKCAIVFGDPLCAEQDIPAFTQKFHNYCQKQNKNVVYITASERFMNWALQNRCKSAIKIGD